MVKLLRVLLFPVSLLYGLVMAVRNVLFYLGFLKSESYPIPVLSIGNITVGGTGKTPHTEYVISLLQNDYSLAVLSRGYGRKTKGFVEVTEQSSSEMCGDEPCQMKRKFPKHRVVVDEDRRNGINELLRNYEPDVVLLDDAYQHRWVRPGFSVLLVDYTRPLYRDFVMPTGYLREFPIGKKRADLVIVTKCPEDITDFDKDLFRKKMRLKEGQEMFFSGFRYAEAEAVFPENNRGTLDLVDVDIVMLTGIANPQPLRHYLERKGARVSALNFSDHHQFSLADMQKLSEVFALLPKDKSYIITTEKDAVRLKAVPNMPLEIKEKMFYVPIEVKILDREKAFNQQIIDYVAKN